MTDPTIAVRQLELIAALITRALDALDADPSAPAIQCHSQAAAALQPTDILVDGMRGPSSIWYRIRINLEHVPQQQRPPQEDLIADYSPWEGYSGHQRP